MAADIIDGNGRITLALLGQKIDQVGEKIDNLALCYKDHSDRISLLERGFDVRGERLKNVENDVTTLETDVSYINNRDRWGTIGTSIAVIVAGIIAWFKQ
jgi:hypothetical protein